MQITRKRLRRIIREVLSESNLPMEYMPYDDNYGGVTRVGAVTYEDWVNLSDHEQETALLDPDAVAAAAAIASVFATGGTAAILTGGLITYELMKDDLDEAGLGLAILGAVPNVGWLTRQIRQIDNMSDATRTASDIARRERLAGMLDDFGEEVAASANLGRASQATARGLSEVLEGNRRWLVQRINELIVGAARLQQTRPENIIRVNNNASPGFARAWDNLRNPNASIDEILDAVNVIKTLWVRTGGILVVGPRGIQPLILSQSHFDDLMRGLYSFATRLEEMI